MILILFKIVWRHFKMSKSTYKKPNYPKIETRTKHYCKTCKRMTATYVLNFTRFCNVCNTKFTKGINGI